MRNSRKKERVLKISNNYITYNNVIRSYRDIQLKQSIDCFNGKTQKPTYSLWAGDTLIQVFCEHRRDAWKAYNHLVKMNGGAR